LILACSAENIQLTRAPLALRRCSPDEEIAAFDAAVEALAAQHADLDLDHVEPADVLEDISSARDTRPTKSWEPGPI